MMDVDIEALLLAARADSIPAGWSGLWYIRKDTFAVPTPGVRGKEKLVLDPGTYTYLRTLTDSSIFDSPPGELVMEDSIHELRSHLQFMIQAYGDILITGLGLGCVIRGLLANPNVKSVTCIEKSKDVLSLVRPYMDQKNLTIIRADALDWTVNNQQKFDCAWHDLWFDNDKKGLHLDLWHAQLISNCRDFVTWQGAWNIDRTVRKFMAGRGIRLSPRVRLKEKTW